MNAGTHGVGFVTAIVGAFILMTEASQEGKSPEHFWGCAIFSASLMFLYLASTLYHRYVGVKACMFIYLFIYFSYFVTANTYLSTDESPR